MNNQHQFLYALNASYVRNEIDYLEHKHEVLDYLEKRLKEIPFNNLLKHNTMLILLILTIFLSFTVGGSLLLLYFGIVGTYKLISSGLFLGLFITIGAGAMGLLSFWLYGKPLILQASIITRYLWAHSSSKQLYPYLLKEGKLAQGWVKGVENKNGQTVIEYSFVPENDKTRRDYYLTAANIHIEAGTTVFVKYTDSVSILL